MSVSDPIADMLTKIRNATMARVEDVEVVSSKLKLEIAKVLKSEGYIRLFKRIKVDKTTRIRLTLKYDQKRKPVIHGIERISKPGRRVYVGYRSVPRVLNGYGTVIVSTSRGVITDKKARKEHKIGGELICRVW